MKAQSIELKKELAEFQTELREMHRTDGRRSRRASTAGAAKDCIGGKRSVSQPGGVGAERSPGRYNARGRAASSKSFRGSYAGTAVKNLMPGPVTVSPTSLAPGYANAEPGGQGVIVPGLEGVSKTFIPDISAVGDFTFRQSDIRRGDARYDPADDKFQPRDTQLIFFSPIDPYTTAQSSIDKPDNGPFDIEEAFLTFNKLPYDLSLRAGQFRPEFGLLNETDTFQLPMVNRPNALAFYLGEDGLVEPGVNLKGYIPNPWDLALKADFNVVSGINPTAFDHHQGQNYDFAYIGSLDYSRDLFTTGALTAGASFAGGPGPGGATYMEDPFVQVRYAPTQRQIWTWNLEALLSERTGDNDHGVKRGIYSLLDYNFRTALACGSANRRCRRSGRGSRDRARALADPHLLRFRQHAAAPPVHAQYGDPGPRPDHCERPTKCFCRATFSLGNLKPLD